MLSVASEMGAARHLPDGPRRRVGSGRLEPRRSPGKAHADPYFGGAGPARRTCLQCGECMTGCRYGAKNTLLTNYLYLAERSGAEVHPLRTVESVRPLADGGWEVVSSRTAARGLAGRRRISAGQVVLAAGTLGTQRLLHRMAWEGKLPGLSRGLGQLTRTNSESLLGAVVPRRVAREGAGERDFTRGVAITSSFYPDPATQVEPVRYGRGSNMMGLFGTPLLRGAEDGRWQGWAGLVASVARRPWEVLRGFDLRGWSERTVIALVMQSRDNSLTVYAKRGFLGRPRLTSRQGHGEPSPTWLPVGHEVVRRLARAIGGQAQGTWGEIFGVPMTAHFLGGCVIGASSSEGVVDPWQRVHGHAGLHIVDGSVVPANPGANPALTITALAERALSYWPNRGDPDPRPPLGAPYERLVPVSPRWPAVPVGAPGSLHLSTANRLPAT